MAVSLGIDDGKLKGLVVAKRIHSVLVYIICGNCFKPCPFKPNIKAAGAGKQTH
jgi:hypothetical protein